MTLRQLMVAIVLGIAVVFTIIIFQHINQAPPPINGEVRVIPERNEILYDRDTGQCWVIERSDDGLVVGTLFNSDEVDECYQFTLK